MSEPLATSDDVVERLGRALTAAESARIDTLLIDASNAVRAYSNQNFTAEESTVTLKVNNRAVRLPQRPITAVASVQDVLDNAVSFTWYAGDEFITLPSLLYLNAFELNFPPGYTIGRVKVAYTHGYDTTPDDVVGIAAQIAARALGTPADETGEPSETIGSYSHGPTMASGPFALLDDEKRILDRYRVGAGPIPVL